MDVVGVVGGWHGGGGGVRVRERESGGVSVVVCVLCGAVCSEVEKERCGVYNRCCAYIPFE
jgi:hypothetical protein